MMVAANYILLDITIRALPPSVNHMYTRQHKTVKKTEAAKDWHLLALQTICLGRPGFTIPLDQPLEFYLVCYFPRTGGRRGSDPLHQNDSDNRLKAAKDAVFAASWVDEITRKKAGDNQVFDDHSAKRRGDPELLDRYPAGYCRIILAHHGHAKEILKTLEQETGGVYSL